MSENLIKNKYISFFIERFVYSVTELEELENAEQRNLLMLNILEAFSYLLGNMDYLNIGDVIRTGNIINESYDVPQGLRRIGVTAGNKATFTPIHPSKIPSELNMLFYQYYHMWNELDPFLREAMFNVKYMRIHPLEDGNKRSGKLILASNMWKACIPPAIITKEDTDDYYAFLNSQDYEGFAEFLRQRSNLETNTLCGFYKILRGLTLTEDINSEEIKKLVLSK